MSTYPRRRRLAAVALLCAGLVLSGCGNDSEPTDTKARQDDARYRDGTRQAASIQQKYNDLPQPTAGDVEISGSTGSLTPLSATRYEQTNNTALNRTYPGDARAFAQLCAGEIDIADSARPITRKEWDACRAVGLDVVQFTIAADAVIVAIKGESDVGGDCLSTDQVRDIYRAGSPVTNWSQLQLDNIPLEAGGPDADSNEAAFSFFSSVVLGSPTPSRIDLRSDYVSKGDDDNLREWVTGTADDQKLNEGFEDVRRIYGGLRRSLKAKLDWWRDATAQIKVAQANQRKGIRDKRTPAERAEDDEKVAAAFANQARAINEMNAVKVKFKAVLPRYRKALEAKKVFDATLGNVAYFRYSYYGTYEQFLRPFEITTPEGERNCIFPSQRTIINGQYPLARRMLLTTTTRSLARPEVKEYLKYAVGSAIRTADQQRLVAIPTATARQQLAWIESDNPPVLVAPEDDGTTTVSQQPADKEKDTEDTPAR